MQAKHWCIAVSTTMSIFVVAFRGQGEQVAGAVSAVDLESGAEILGLLGSGSRSCSERQDP
jgi:hypothetical protein